MSEHGENVTKLIAWAEHIKCKVKSKKSIVLTFEFFLLSKEKYRAFKYLETKSLQD